MALLAHWIRSATVAVVVPWGLGLVLAIGCGDDAASTTGAGTGTSSDTEGTTTADTTDGETSTEIPEPAEICDGSDRIRLGIYLPTGVDQVEPVTYMKWENGARFLFVLGDCTYWVSGPSNPSRSDRVHTGTLSAEDATALAEDFRYGQWSALGLWGYWWPSPDEWDVSTTVFFDGAYTVVCGGGCNAQGVSPEVHAMRDAEHPWVEKLWNEGEAADDAVRILAVRILQEAPYENIPAAQWPLDGTPLESLAYDDPELVPMEPGQSVRFEGADAQALIDIWEEYLSGAHGELWRSYGMIPIVGADPAVRYRMFIRDSIPLEDAMGLIDAPDIRPEG